MVIRSPEQQVRAQLQPGQGKLPEPPQSIHMQRGEATHSMPATTTVTEAQPRLPQVTAQVEMPQQAGTQQQLTLATMGTAQTDPCRTHSRRRRHQTMPHRLEKGKKEFLFFHVVVNIQKKGKKKKVLLDPILLRLCVPESRYSKLRPPAKRTGRAT